MEPARRTRKPLLAVSHGPCPDRKITTGKLFDPELPLAEVAESLTALRHERPPTIETLLRVYNPAAANLVPPECPLRVKKGQESERSLRVGIPGHYVKSRPLGQPPRDLCLVYGPGDLLLVRSHDQAKQIGETIGSEEVKLVRSWLKPD